MARWALLPAHLLVPVAAVRRWPGVAAVAAGLSVYQLVLTRRARGRHRPDPVPPGSTPVWLVGANLLLSNPTIEAAGRRLIAEPVDVLALTELTPDHLRRLQDCGVLEAFPYALVSEQPGFHGAGLFSRWPLSDLEVLDLEGAPVPVATVATPDGPLRVAAVHANNPGAPGRLRPWQRQLAELASIVTRSAVPIVLVGDFNATADHADFRRLLAAGLRDAYDIAGRGSGASWPVWPRWRGLVPPLMRLDHALVSAGTAVRSATVADTPGSDHRHLRVEVHRAPRSA